jgi:Nucleotidyl transferase AbiEii toxin, Type IV TA system
MTKRPIKDVAASVRHRLQDKAKSNGRPFQELLQYFGMERFLYRLARSAHADSFVLKGALMFNVWKAPFTRSTKDIDLLGRGENTIETLVSVVRDACDLAVEPDGLVFDSNSVRGMRIKEDADYEGVRIAFLGKLQNARIPMQVDVGFGDVAFPAPSVIDYPTILDLPGPQLRGYNRETTVAEKFEAMVKLGQLNSRMKDFYDLWLLARQFDFDGMTLAEAVGRTFQHRATEIPSDPVALTPAFGTDPAKTAQWIGFLRRLRVEGAPKSLSVVVEDIGLFLRPLAAAIAAGQQFNRTWRAPGPWT